MSRGGTLHCVDCGRPYPGGERGGHCPTCHESFKSDGAFDDHRTGPFNPPGARRCRTPDEMRARGMTQTDLGYWKMPGTWTGPNNEGEHDG